MKQGKAAVCSSWLHERLFVRLYSQNNAMTFIKFDIGDIFFSRFGTVVTVFRSKADDERHCAHEKNKIFIKERVFIPRATKWIFFARRQKFSLSFTLSKCRETSMRWNSIYREVYPESRDITGLWLNENRKKLPVAIFHDFSGASNRVVNEIESVPWWPQSRKCLRVTLAI